MSKRVDLGVEHGLGHQDGDDENEITEMDDEKLRNVTRLLSLGYKDVNLKVIVKNLDYQNKNNIHKVRKLYTSRQTIRRMDNQI